jgi:cytochrome c peroxidase
MFHDGRVELDSNQPGGFRSPAGNDLPEGLDNVLAVQAMFPVTSPTEMAGQPGENRIADIAAEGNLKKIWNKLAKRLRRIPEYVDLFLAAFSDVYLPEDITFVHAANAIAAFESHAFRADNSPFDRFVRGDNGAMSRSARKGMKLFYGKAGCASCHSGIFQTDQAFHGIAMPQIGPGKGDGPGGYGDFGREKVTGDLWDRCIFRTPSLRNVALTGPWGHDGAYNSLQAVVRHVLNPLESLYNYDTAQAVLPNREDLNAIDFLAHQIPEVNGIIASANELEAIDLSDLEIEHLIEFLHALTGPDSIDLRGEVPNQVPSGLPLAE